MTAFGSGVAKYGMSHGGVANEFLNLAAPLRFCAKKRLDFFGTLIFAWNLFRTLDFDWNCFGTLNFASNFF